MKKPATNTITDILDPKNPDEWLQFSTLYSGYISLTQLTRSKSSLTKASAPAFPHLNILLLHRAPTCFVNHGFTTHTHLFLDSSKQREFSGLPKTKLCTQQRAKIGPAAVVIRKISRTIPLRKTRTHLPPTHIVHFVIVKILGPLLQRKLTLSSVTADINNRISYR